MCCAGPRSGSVLAGPAAVLRQYLQALQRDDPRAAYALLDGPTKQRLPYSKFAAEWASSRDERDQQRQDLLAQVSFRAPVATEAIVSLGDGGRVSLIDDRLVDGDLRTLKPQSPQEALRLFAAAVERRDPEAVLRLFSPEQRQQIEAELQERLSRLKAALRRNQPVEQSGDHAHYQYDPRYFIDLQKDGSGWHVFDVN